MLRVICFLGVHAPLEIAHVCHSVRNWLIRSLKQHHKLEIISYIVPHGSEWSPMVPFLVLYGPVGHIWSHMILYVPIWSHMVLHGPVWSRIVLYGPLWCSMVLFGPAGNVWYHMVPHGTT